MTLSLRDPEASITRLWDAAKSRVVGIGFLVPGNQVVTCAHVVADARKYADPNGPLWLDLPLIAPLSPYSATVVKTDSVLDAALLRLVEIPPNGARPLPFASLR